MCLRGEGLRQRSVRLRNLNIASISRLLLYNALFEAKVNVGAKVKASSFQRDRLHQSNPRF